VSGRIAGAAGLLLLTGLVFPLRAREIKPTHYARRTEIRIADKPRTYYQLHENDALEITLTGPVVLEMHFRSETRRTEGQERYRILYTMDDGGPRLLVNLSGGRAQQATIRGRANRSVTTSDLLTIQVPRGTHVYRFYNSTRNAHRVYARPVIKKAPVVEPVTHANCKPTRAGQVIDLRHGDKALSYYRLAADTVAVVEIEGPRELVIYSRLEFAPWMEEPGSYRLQISDHQQIIGIYQFMTAKSMLTEYTAVTDKVVGQVRHLTLTVPPGSHIYTFRLLDKQKSALLKFRKS